jgi:DNA-directed RNA polymerase specialized sigma24 family protein
MRRLAGISQHPSNVGDLGDLYEVEGVRLWRAVFAWCQDRAVTDDAVAEAFAQCLRRGGAIRDPRAWVWTAAYRIASGELKARARLAGADELLKIGIDGPSSDAIDLLAALRRLPANQRAAVVLHYYGGWDTKEIAQALGAGRATVRVHLSRGRRRLRELLEEDEI